MSLSSDARSVQAVPMISTERDNRHHSGTHGVAVHSSDTQAALAWAARRRLSDEVILVIADAFLRVCDWDTLDTTSGPWLLSHVCRGWRRIIVSTPRYWSRIRVRDVGRVRTIIWPGWCMALILSLERAADRPLNVDFTARGSVMSKEYVLFMLLLKRSHFWLEANLCITQFQLLDHMRDRRGRFDKLRALSLSIGAGPLSAAGIETVYTIQFFEDSPHLNCIQLEGRHIFPVVRANWARLSSCCLRFHDAAVVVKCAHELLRAAGQLRFLRVDATVYTVGPGLSPTLVGAHASLQTLCYYLPGLHRDFFGLLTLPNLHTLHSRSMCDELWELIGRSSCPMRKLQTIFVQQPTRQEVTNIVHVLEECPGLHSLEILLPSNSRDVYDIYKALSRNSSSRLKISVRICPASRYS